MDDFKKEVAQVLSDAIESKEFSAQKIFEILETPPSKEFGDLAFPTFKLAPHYKREPTEIAKELAEKLDLIPPIVQAKAVGPYINFFISKELLAKDVLTQILKEKENFGKNNEFAGQKILIEYSQPNTNKPLHVGHLRNNSIAMSVSFLLEKSGAKVKRVDLFNDRGIHICQSMLAYKKWGKNKTPKQAKLKSDHFVGKYYVLYHQKEKENSKLKEELTVMLLKWEKGDKKTILLWKKMNKWAEDGFKQTYKDFGSKFDKIYRESEIFKSAMPAIEMGLKKGVFEKEASGAVIADLKKYGLGKKTVLRADGTSIYLTQDIALAQKKFDYFKFDKSIYVVASEQRTYFLQLFKILELLGFAWSNKLFHLSYGLVNLREGKLKSREGKIIDADTLIYDLISLSEKEIQKRYDKLSKKEVKKRASAISLAAIKFYMLKTDSKKDVLFEPERAVSFEGDTGPYIMYTYARAKSILRKQKEPKKFDPALLTHEHEKDILTLINKFQSVLEQSSSNFSPHKLCTYLLELSSAFNSFYHKLPVLKEEKKIKEARLALVKATSIVLSIGLKQLNIEPLEQM